MFSFSTPGISTTILISFSEVMTSASGSRSAVIFGPSVLYGLTFPNSRTMGLPSGPIVIEYPYTIGPTSRTFPPSGVSYSLTNSFGAFGNLLNCSSNMCSISFLISSMSPNMEGPKPNLRLPQNRLSHSLKSSSQLFILLPVLLLILIDLRLPTLKISPCIHLPVRINPSSDYVSILDNEIDSFYRVKGLNFHERCKKYHAQAHYNKQRFSNFRCHKTTSSSQYKQAACF